VLCCYARILMNFDVRSSFGVFASHRVKLQCAHMDGVIVSVMFFWLIFQLVLKTELCSSSVHAKTATLCYMCLKMIGKGFYCK